MCHDARAGRLAAIAKPLVDVAPLPRPVAQCSAPDSLEERLIAGLEPVISNILVFWEAARDVHGHTALPTILLPIVHEVQPWRGQGEHGRSHVLVQVGQNRRRPVLVVIFKEAHEFVLPHTHGGGGEGEGA